MSLLDELREKLRANLEARDAVKADVAGILAAADAESRSLTDDEKTAHNEKRAEIRDLDERRVELEERIADLEDEERRDAEAEKVRRTLPQAPADPVRVGVGSEPLTYRRGDRTRSYFCDLWNARTHGDRSATSRLSSHAAEMRVELPKLEADIAKRAAAGMPEGAAVERRDLDRDDGDGGEFVPPLWMVAEYIGLSRAGRVTANLVQNRPLPPGTDSINLPKVATGTATAAQTADNANVSETDLTSTSVQGNVKTIAGQQDIALQLLEQSPIGFDEVVFMDLAGDHAVKLDQQVISGSNASGQVRGIRLIPSVDTTAYTDADPTLPELYPKIADSINQVVTSRFLPAEAVIMHPRRWYWAASRLDTANRPFIVPSDQGPQNVLASQQANVAEGFVGRTLGVPTFVDPNIPTNVGGGTEDIIIVTRPSDLWLFEGDVRTRVLPEVLSGSLTVRLQLYSYVAFIPHRWSESTSIVSGTGLAAPTF